MVVDCLVPVQKIVHFVMEDGPILLMLIEEGFGVGSVGGAIMVLMLVDGFGLSDGLTVGSSSKSAAELRVGDEEERRGETDEKSGGEESSKVRFSKRWLKDVVGIGCLRESKSF